MSYIIQHVTVEGLWGVKSFDTDFHTDINILIGQNGSNKTTFLSLIESCLTCELHTLQQVPFRKIIFTLCDEDETYTIVVERLLDEEWVVIRYTMDDGEELEIKLFGEYEDSFYRGNGAMREKIFRIRELLRQKINMSWLSVDRYTDDYEDSRRKYRNVVDKKLSDLLRELVAYRQGLVEQINKQTMELYADVLSLLLYDEATDNFDMGRIDNFTSMDPKEIQTNLFRVFGQMGKAAVLKDKIRNHISKLTEAIERVKQDGKMMLNDVALLVLISKTLRMLELSKKYKEECDRIMEPIDTYRTTLERFIKDKKITFSEDQGRLQINWTFKGSKEVHYTMLNPHNLSSGEKQLLILLTQTLLQEKSPYIFIADEPELSLHIEWQKHIVGAINGINPNAQILVATHSPEIAGQWAKKIITMESITRYED